MSSWPATFSAAIPPTRFEYEHPKVRRALVEQIRTCMNLPERGLLVWFDTQETGSERMKGAAFYFEMLAGFHPLEGISVASEFPDRVRDRMAQDMFRALVWVGRDVIDSDDCVRFTIVLGHELRHVEQYLFNAQLHYANVVILNYLYRLSAHIKTRYTRYESPVEFDAEIRARAIASLVCGEDGTREFYVAKGEGFEPFITAIEIPGLRELEERVSKWLQTHSKDIGKVAKRPDEVTRMRDYVQDLEWSAFGLESPLNDAE